MRGINITSVLAPLNRQSIYLHLQVVDVFVENGRIMLRTSAIILLSLDYCLVD